jgi:hypothetical protein
VTYTYQAANTGNTPLGTPTLSDDTPTCASPTRGADAPGDDDDTVELHARTSWGDILIRRPSTTPAR